MCCIKGEGVRYKIYLIVIPCIPYGYTHIYYVMWVHTYVDPLYSSTVGTILWFHMILTHNCQDPLVGLANLEWHQANKDPNGLIPEAELPFERVAVDRPEGDEREFSGVGETSTLSRRYRLGNVV